MLQALMATGSSTIFGSISASTTDIATATDYPTSSARRYLEELTAVKLVTRKSEGHIACPARALDDPFGRDGG
jgi:DNA-binding IclR family transcriptional regulator